MRHRLFAFAALALVLGPASDASATPKRKVIDRVVAVIDEACITKSELERYAAPYEKTASANATATELPVIALRVRREALNALIDRLLISREAMRLGLAATPEEIDRAIDTLAASYGLTREGVLSAAAEQGLDATRYRDELRAQIVEAKLLQLETPKRHPDWNVLGVDAKSARMSETRVALVAELRASAFVEVRL
jgi:parvulin-like peptidyl-prolyl isomerase